MPVACREFGTFTGTPVHHPQQLLSSTELMDAIFCLIMIYSCTKQLLGAGQGQAGAAGELSSCSPSPGWVWGPDPAKSAKSSSSRVRADAEHRMGLGAELMAEGTAGGRMCPAELEQGQGCSQQLLRGASVTFGALQRAQRGAAQLCPAPGDATAPSLARGRRQGGASRPRELSAPRGDGSGPAVCSDAGGGSGGGSGADGAALPLPCSGCSAGSREHKTPAPPGGLCGCSIP